MRTLRLAPALLLALAACSVDTESLKPKQSSDCPYAAGLKVCGNRCMPLNDPATGCGNPGCEPCPTGGGDHEVLCGPTFECISRTRCQLGKAYCDGPYDTSCEDLSSDRLHCGGCGHSCASAACNSFECDPTIVHLPGVQPQDVASDGSSIFWIANDYVSAGNVALFRDGVLARQWSGYGYQLAADAYGVVVSSPYDGDPIYQVNGLTLTTLFTPASGVRSLALDPSSAYFAEWGSLSPNESAIDVVVVSRNGSGTAWGHAFTGDVALTAVAVAQPGATGSNLLVGTQSGAIRWLSWDLLSSGTYATGIEPPRELVVFNGYVGPGATTLTSHAFWLGASGHLYQKELPAGPVWRLTNWETPSGGALDLFADGGGVYWVDSGRGLVAEWRAAYDDVVPLRWAPGSTPSRVTATATDVVWLNASGVIMSVPK